MNGEPIEEPPNNQKYGLYNCMQLSTMCPPQEAHATTFPN
jgi:hypothetical protein